MLMLKKCSIKNSWVQNIEYLTIDQNMIVHIWPKEVCAIEVMMYFIFVEPILLVLMNRMMIGRKIRVISPMQLAKTKVLYFSFSNSE